MCFPDFTIYAHPARPEQAVRTYRLPLKQRAAASYAGPQSPPRPRGRPSAHWVEKVWSKAWRDDLQDRSESGQLPPVPGSPPDISSPPNSCHPFPLCTLRAVPVARPDSVLCEQRSLPDGACSSAEAMVELPPADRAPPRGCATASACDLPPLALQAVTRFASHPP
jgi:hypothetical protein